MQKKTKGMILKERNIGENDRILTVLTADRGLIEVCARRSRSPKSPLIGATQVLCYSEFCLFQGKSYETVDSAEIIESFYDLRLDVVKLSLAGYFVQLCAFLSPTEENCAEVLRLLLNTCYFLEKETYSIAHLKPVFELRILSLSGFMPNVVACDRCAAYESDEMVFLPLYGRLMCKECYELSEYASPDTMCVHLHPAVLAAVRHIVFSPFEKLFSFQIPATCRRQLYDLAEVYTQMHTETELKSWTIFNTLFDRGNI